VDPIFCPLSLVKNDPEQTETGWSSMKKCCSIWMQMGALFNAARNRA
jgi:hypothetical protein